MEKIKNFDEFVNESWEDIKDNANKTAAGLCIVCDNKMLLVLDRKDKYLGIPKGGIDNGEDPLDAAIRETMEETGITVEYDQIKQDPYVVHTYKKNGELKYQLIYFLVQLASISEIGLSHHEILKERIQADEISWAGFVGPDGAYPTMSESQRIILDRHLNL